MPERARASAPVASTSARTRCMNGRSVSPSAVRVTGPWPGPRLKSDDAELVLEQADLARQAGLGQVQAVGGPGEALLLGDGEGVGELVQLHRVELLIQSVWL